MHPIADKLLAILSFTLGNLVFVVRELEVLAPGVNIDGLAEVLGGHHGALDVPAGTALAPWGIPADFTRLSGLPESKVHRVFLLIDLIGADVLTGPDFKVVNRLAGQLSIVLELPGPVVNVAVLLVGIALVDQAADEFNDVGDVFRCPRMQGRRLNIDGCRVLHEGIDVLLCQLGHRNALLVGRLDHLVINVGKVGDVVHLVALKFQVAPHCVKSNCRTGIADVNVIVNRRATDIHVNNAWMQRLKLFFFPGQRIINC